mmetsp:Transcript_102817/g.268401  ORF Transcript_102817/g.268401 Transcript_102817/m.268401 type:complete len:168 (+) Transcript_102817:404-907(+)
MRRNDSGATPAPLPIGAKGDPHMVNIHGQRFDLMQSGIHPLVHVPQHAKSHRILLKVTANVERIGAACGDMYIQGINVTGRWAQSSARRKRGMFYSVKHPPKRAAWKKFGNVSVKVVYGHTSQNIAYLNFMVRGLTQLAYPVGGLLGLDDHTAATEKDPGCARAISL